MDPATPLLGRIHAFTSGRWHRRVGRERHRPGLGGRGRPSTSTRPRTGLRAGHSGGLRRVRDGHDPSRHRRTVPVLREPVGGGPDQGPRPRSRRSGPDEVAQRATGGRADRGLEGGRRAGGRQSWPGCHQRADARFGQRPGGGQGLLPGLRDPHRLRPGRGGRRSGDGRSRRLGVRRRRTAVGPGRGPLPRREAHRGGGLSRALAGPPGGARPDPGVPGLGGAAGPARPPTRRWRASVLVPTPRSRSRSA